MDSWTHHMQRGNFAAAWQVSDEVMRARRQLAPCWHLPRHEQYLWLGEPLRDRRVLVRCYHGLGDTIQFARYLPLLRAIAKEVIVWAQPALLELLRYTGGIDRLLPLHDGTPEVEYDADVEIMELAHVFRSTLETLPAQVPYIHPPPVASGQTTRRDARLRVGVIWQSGEWDSRRSVPLPLVAALAEIRGVTLHALQRGPALAQWQPGFGPVSGDDNVLRTALTMQGLDLILSVDSFPAHLAGALGRPTWTLLHAEPDWRWLEGREDSPWYPTMRLFRQGRAGDWPAVLDRVAHELRALAQTIGAASAAGAKVTEDEA